MKGHKEDTILAWLRDVAEHAAALEAELLARYRIERGQLDSLWAYVDNKGENKGIRRLPKAANSHHDHIGCNAQMQDATGCLIAAPAAYAAWHVDFERHYQEFARPVPDLIPDMPALRDEVLSVLDAPRPVDIYLEEGVTFDLGDAVLEAISLPGHMREEFGWLDRTSGVLILGDAITGLDWRSSTATSQ